MTSKSFKPIFIIFLFVILIAMPACGGGQTPVATQAPAPTAASVQPTEAPAATSAPTSAPAVPTEAASGAINSIADAKKAVIQIEAEGSFVDPEVGQVFNGAGRGSGFIIDPSGLAVTNNHVVTGAGLLKVWVGGDQSKTYHARVLGVSECADLAVIDIEGDGYPYLSWYSGPIDVGKEIYVAGFPLGDPEYSLTKGIISKAKANGETNWASVDSVIEYDANTNPGNSGGPVLTSDAQVVGVHYAGNGQTRQAFGISRDFAEGVVEKLRQDENLDWIGVNGQAVSNEDGSLTGVWVSSVQSGSPADKAGLKGGDIITKLENLVLASDGTMSEYCGILRSHKSSDTLNLQVLRFDTNEVLEGQLNGRTLAVSQTLSTGSESNANSSSSQGTTTEGTPAASSGTFNPDASASGDVYFGTEFDAELSDWVYFLTEGKESGANASLKDSKLRLDIRDQYTYIYFYLDPLEVADVRVDTKVENLGVNNNNVSLICRYSDAGWYEFNVANNGEYTIFRYDPARSDPYIALYTGGSTAIETGKGTNEITAVCTGDELTLGINGVKVRTVQDRNLKSGKVGLSVSSFNVTPVIVEFDYFVASVP
ncbi:MAG: peptidase family protein [Chloroflexi bacterium]|nr:peptidase family protein [Chloroflexota bacterium]